MKNLILRTALLFLISLLVFSANLSATQTEKKPDVRLLIDISGSMKKNDPKNLRIPALQLVTNLMPKGADAGVWAFGKYVNMLVKLSAVDEAWQNQATLTANKINSAGLYTNIGGALEKASYGWSSPNPDEKRSVILLTDGMVDIDKDPTINQRERQRILTELLPKLANAGVTIHTIALSANADHELLETLSQQTDGWYQAVESADELQKIFLKIFEQAAARDSLPLDENRFKVDASIEEMTLLVFKNNQSKETKLISPSEQVISKQDSGSQLRWFATDSYDLITVKSPQVGDWKIDADVDPDNRVMVVSDLKLSISDVPNNLLAGEAIDYQVALLEDGKLIERDDFLKLVKPQLIQEKQGKTSRLAMFYDANSHQYKQSFFTDSFDGVLNLTLEVKSPTFERTRNHAINIYGSPLVTDVQVSQSESQPHQLSFSVREDIVKADTLSINISVTSPSGEKQYFVLDNLSNPIEVPVESSGGIYQVGFDIKGQSVIGRDFSVSPEPLVFEAPSLITLPEIVEEEPVEQVAQPDEPQQSEAPEETVDDSPTEIEQDQEPSVEEEPTTDWTFWLYIGLGVNLILIVGGFFAWKLIKSRKQKDTQALTDALGIDDSSENQASQKAPESAESGKSEPASESGDKGASEQAKQADVASDTDESSGNSQSQENEEKAKD